MRVGFGYSIYRFTKKGPLIIGGVSIPVEKSSEEESDTDVMVNATADALLGAAGLGDIQGHYPETDKNFDGMDFLKEIEKLVNFEKYIISNVDVTLVIKKSGIRG